MLHGISRLKKDIVSLAFPKAKGDYTIFNRYTSLLRGIDDLAHAVLAAEGLQGRQTRRQQRPLQKAYKAHKQTQQRPRCFPGTSLPPGVSG